jgi:hypothetical protein
VSAHAPPFVAALAAIVAHIGEPTECERHDGAGYSLARWRREGTLLELDDYAGEMFLRAERDGVGGDYGAVIDEDHSAVAVLRVACAWLGWQVARDAVGYDANGSPVCA